MIFLFAQPSLSVLTINDGCALDILSFKDLQECSSSGVIIQYVSYLPAEREVLWYHGQYCDPRAPLEDHSTGHGTRVVDLGFEASATLGTRAGLSLSGVAIVKGHLTEGTVLGTWY